MKPHTNIPFYSLLLIILFVAASCGRNPENSQGDISTPVTIIELKKGSISKYLNTTGTANPLFKAELNSEIAGEYKLQTNPKTGKPFKLGDAVSKGQVIIRLDDQEYENGIALDSKELSLEIAEQEQKKQKMLYDKGGVTLSETRNTEVTVNNARYDYENGKLNLDKMAVKTPFAGVIVDLPHYTQGVKVDQGKPMVSIMDYARMYMDINLPESAINDIKTNQPVYITHYTLPHDTLKGIIAELSPAISMETRTFKGKLTIDNQGLKIRPGMFVKADVMVDKLDSVLVIPKNIIQSQRNNKYVFIVMNNTANIRYLQTGMEDEENIQVLDGLKENDNVVVRGFETLRHDSKVKVQR